MTQWPSSFLPSRRGGSSLYLSSRRSLLGPLSWPEPVLASSKGPGGALFKCPGSLLQCEILAPKHPSSVSFKQTFAALPGPGGLVGKLEKSQHALSWQRARSLTLMTHESFVSRVPLSFDREALGAH